MKKFINVEIEIVSFAAEDVITTSTDLFGWNGNQSGTKTDTESNIFGA